ncbi:FAD-binding oxidoreductase [Halorubrum sp. Eb13]|uniref:NAD(P)/FAD-dependent oxidoreductase n=1 Tax=Halorubrum sp. Eb13 TaxID=1383843 RepID=UPI0020CC5F70|nr:FAD-dependent oxidoreductase [Halorubrum sp. Eb13]
MGVVEPRKNDPTVQIDGLRICRGRLNGFSVTGGGVIGCAAARELAPDHRVLLLERDQIASGATARAAGEVTMEPSYTDYPEIADYATDFFRRYDGTGSFEYTQTPSAELVTPDREDEARARVDRLRKDGVEVAFLEPSEVEDRWPQIDPSSFAGAVRFTDTGHLDPYTLTTTLQSDAEAHDARFETGVTVTEILEDGERVTGVDTEDGAIRSDNVLVATGWRVNELLTPILEVPIRPYRTQCLVLRPDSSLSDAFPMGWIPGEHVYFRREGNGDLLVGGWSFAEDDPTAASERADEAFQDHVAGLVPRFLRADGRLRVVDGWAGIDGATPDTRPIIDSPADAPDGLVIAAGFHGRGVMSAPVAGRLVRCLTTGEDPPVPTRPFSLSRFDSRSPDFEFLSISAGGD